MERDKSRLSERSEEIKRMNRGKERRESDRVELRRMQRGLESLCSVSKPSIKVAERGEMIKIEQKCSNLPAPSVCNIVTNSFHVFCDDMRTLVCPECPSGERIPELVRAQ